MSQELFEKIARECRQLSIAKMLFSGFGEPLIDKNIVSKIKLARENGIKEITLFTNASLLDERIASDLVRSGVSAVIISLDATTTEDFAKIKPGIGFYDLHENIIRFLKLRNEARGVGLEVKIRLMQLGTHKNNDDFIATLKKLKAHVVYPALHDWSGQWNYGAVSRKEGRLVKKWPCHLLWTSFTVLWNGAVPLCCKDFNGTIHFGDASKNSLAAIWKNKAWNAIWKKHIERLFNDIALCNTCEMTQTPTSWWRMERRRAGINKVQVLRNCVVPELGLHILNHALQKEKLLFDIELK